MRRPSPSLLWHVMAATEKIDHAFMEAALAEARAAAERGEVPVGAVVVLQNEIVARAGNRTIGDCDPTAHAEILALRERSKNDGKLPAVGRFAVRDD